MNDLPTLILIGIIVVAVVLLIQRLMRQQSPYSKPGNETPHYNDPNISSHGGFGGANQNQNQKPGQNRPQYNDPNIESHGGFGPSGGSTSTPSASRSRNIPTASSQSRTDVATKTAERTRDNDDPNISSHGGFGGNK